MSQGIRPVVHEPRNWTHSWCVKKLDPKLMSQEIGPKCQSPTFGVRSRIPRDPRLRKANYVSAIVEKIGKQCRETKQSQYCSLCNWVWGKVGYFLFSSAKRHAPVSIVDNFGFYRVGCSTLMPAAVTVLGGADWKTVLTFVLLMNPRSNVKRHDISWGCLMRFLPRHPNLSSSQTQIRRRKTMRKASRLRVVQKRYPSIRKRRENSEILTK